MFDFTPKHDYLVGIDSDGCAFDTMELKHKECFIPNIINFMELQGVSKYAREAAEFVNLYSKSRGINRFPALVETLEWLQKRPEVKARGMKITVPQALRDWIARETKLGNPALEKAVEKNGDADLKHILAWSAAWCAAYRRSRSSARACKNSTTKPTVWWFRPRRKRPFNASGTSTT